jgi:flagellar hook protein FlgE
MSLSSALATGVSGLKAQSAAMAVISDNIANVNTVGYKGSEAKFSTLVINGGQKSGYTAGGVEAKPRTLISKQGLLQASASSTDLAIDGNGFFVVRKDRGAESSFVFTRAGSFQPDAEGYLKNDANLYLQGWRLDNLGNVVGGTEDTLAPLRITDINGTAEPTSRIAIRANLSSKQDALVGPYVAGDMATGTVEPHFTRAFDVYDQQGGVHQVRMSFVKLGNNQWGAEVYANPSDTSAGAAPLASGTIQFNPDGSLDLAGSTPALFAPINMGDAAPAVTWMAPFAPCSSCRWQRCRTRTA